jgi:hypothetical protein
MACSIGLHTQRRHSYEKERKSLLDMIEAMNAHEYEQDTGFLRVHGGIMVMLLGKHLWEAETPALRGLVRTHADLIWFVFGSLFLVCCKFSGEPPPWSLASEGVLLSPQRIGTLANISHLTNVSLAFI